MRDWMLVASDEATASGSVIAKAERIAVEQRQQPRFCCSGVA